METDSPRLAFLGGATIVQETKKVEVGAALFAEGAPPASSFFGHYWGADPPDLRSGVARIRFGDGSEADAALAEIDHDRGGFRIRGHLEDTRELTKRLRESKA